MNKQIMSVESASSRLALFDFAFRHAPIGMALVDTEGRIIRGNRSFSTMVGITPERLEGVAFASFTYPDDLEADLSLFNEVLEKKRDGYTIEKRYVRPDGSLISVRIHVAAMRDTQGEVVRFISQVEDITQAKEAERQLEERAAQLELAMEAVRGGFWHLAIPSRKFETSERLAQYIGGPNATKMDLEAYTSRITVEDLPAADLSALINGTVDQNVVEYRLETAFGVRWMRCDRRLLRDADGAPLKIVGMAIDFTDEHSQIEKLQHNALTDSLTGLLNRRGLMSRFSALSSSTGYCVLAIDLDGFKEVNDRFGHPAGDVVLVETGKRFAACVRSDDLVCRIGGDEFVLVTAGSKASGITVAERAVDAMRKPFFLSDGEVNVHASVGGVWHAANTDLEAMIAQADAALYRVKLSGKNGALFDDNIATGAGSLQ